jgi:hypothetical protein
MRIRAIYAAADAFRGLPPAKRRLILAEHLRPLLESFFDWVRQVRAVIIPLGQRAPLHAATVRNQLGFHHRARKRLRIGAGRSVARDKRPNASYLDHRSFTTLIRAPC